MTPLLSVEHLAREFSVADGGFGRRRTLRAVDDVSFEVDRGETVALVGESGCGKSTTGLAMLRLIEPTAGSVRFQGQDLRALSHRELRRRRADLQAVFQDPRGQLDPRLRLRDIIAEPLRAQHRPAAARNARVRELLDLVGLPDSFAERYPHELSGGQRQRVGIARALATEPSLIMCDEAVAALDVSVQTQVLNLLNRLQADLGVAIVFISHGMAAVRYVADRVVVMYLGRDVETAPAEEFFAAPAHPYSQALLSAVPEVDPATRRERIVLAGDVPSPFDERVGCVFASRCPQVQDICLVERPPRIAVGAGRTVDCHFPLVAPESEPS